MGSSMPKRDELSDSRRSAGRKECPPAQRRSVAQFEVLDRLPQRLLLDLEIDGRGRKLRVAKHLAHGLDGSASLDEMRSEGPAEGMRMGAESGSLGGSPDDPTKGRRLDGTARSGKEQEALVPAPRGE